MLVHHSHVEVEIVKWLLLFFIASALLLAFTSSTSGYNARIESPSAVVQMVDSEL